MSRKLLILGAAALASAAVLLFLMRDTSKTGYPSLVNEHVLEALPREDRSNIDTSHLKNGLMPPTNKWFSGLALQKTPHAVFPMPLSFRPTDTSFEIGLPEVAATDNIIFGPHAAMIRAEVRGATSYQVVRYDELSVDLEFANQHTGVGTVTLTAGSPYIFFTAKEDTSLLIEHDGAVNIAHTEATVELDEKTIALAGFNGATIVNQDGRIVVTTPKGAHIAFYALPHKGDEKIIQKHAANRVTGTQVNYKKQDNAYQTTLTINTANKQPTVLGFLPHHNPLIATLPSSYQTIYGEMTLASGNEFTFSTPEVVIQSSLNVADMSEGNRRLLVETLRKDIDNTHFEKTDTYFGGKALYRAAQLLDLANQLGEVRLATSIQQKLVREFEAWLSADNHADKHFYYDTRIKGIVGSPTSFGSDMFNDHHFHYGYFIYAASILAKYDATFLERHKDFVNLLVADIANYRSDPEIPLRRHFDPYFGHSWASGPAPFHDGNNQESSSEAINAWVAIGLWAEQTNNARLREQAAWMLSNEVATANAYWLHFNTQAQPYGSGYQHPVIALNWGGKREYATFFSQEPNAMLGIQLIPMNPTMGGLRVPADRIRQNIEAALPDGSYDRQFGDYILMYQVLADNPKQLLDVAKTLPDTAIDGANSRSYLYAWLISHR